MSSRPSPARRRRMLLSLAATAALALTAALTAAPGLAQTTEDEGPAFPRRGEEPPPAAESTEPPAAPESTEPPARAPEPEPYAYPPVEPAPAAPTRAAPAVAPERAPIGGAVGVGGGVFQPWDGKVGGGGMIQGFAVLLDGHLRIGGEFEGRTYETRVFSVDDVDVQSYVLRPQAQWVFFPKSITPYLGLGLSLHVNVWDQREIERARPGLDLDGNVGTSGGIVGIAGVEAPLGDHLSVFLEGRADASVQFTQECATVVVNGFLVDVCDDVKSNQLGGATGLLGVRFRF